MPSLRKGKELSFWILHEIMEIVCFSANVRQCNIAFGVVLVHVCFISFLFIIIFLSGSG